MKNILDYNTKWGFTVGEIPLVLYTLSGATLSYVGYQIKEGDLFNKNA